MEAKHNLYTGVTDLFLTDEDEARLNLRRAVRARHTHTHQPVTVRVKNKIYDNGRELTDCNQPSARFGPDGSLDVEIPLGADEPLALPFKMSSELVEPGPFTTRLIGNLGGLVLSKAGDSQAE